MDLSTISVILMSVLGIQAATRHHQEDFICRAGYFPEGGTASVICMFPLDVSNISHSYNYIVDFKPHGSDSAKEVLNCRKTDDCDVNEAFHVNPIVANRLELTIANVTPRWSGTYSCQLIPPNGFGKTPCILDVFALEKTQPADCKTTCPGNDETGTGWSSQPLNVIVGLLVLVLVGLIVGVVILIFLCRRNRPHDSKQDSSKQGAFFDAWLDENKLSKETRKALVKHRLTKVELLMMAEETDIADLKLPSGDTVNLRSALDDLRSTKLEKAGRRKHFQFDDWIRETGLSAKTKKVLIKNKLTSKDTLTAAKDSDTGNLKLLVGERISLRMAIRDLQETTETTQAQEETVPTTDNMNSTSVTQQGSGGDPNEQQNNSNSDDEEAREDTGLLQYRKLDPAQVQQTESADVRGPTIPGNTENESKPPVCRVDTTNETRSTGIRQRHRRRSQENQRCEDYSEDCTSTKEEASIRDDSMEMTDIITPPSPPKRTAKQPSEKTASQTQASKVTATDAKQVTGSEEDTRIKEKEDTGVNGHNPLSIHCVTPTKKRRRSSNEPTEEILPSVRQDKPDENEKEMIEDQKDQGHTQEDHKTKNVRALVEMFDPATRVPIHTKGAAGALNGQIDIVGS